MSDSTDQPEERLERMLRRWGSAEAAEREGLRAAPSTLWRGAPAGGTIVRSMGVAAGILMAVGALLFLGIHLGRRGLRSRVEGLRATADAREQELQGLLTEARGELGKAELLRGDAEKALLKWKRRHAELQQEHTEALARLERALAATRPATPTRPAFPPDEREKLQGQVRVLALAAKQAEEKLAAAKKELTEVRGELATARSDMARSGRDQADLRKRLAAATAELTRLGEAQRKAVADARQAAGKVAALEAQRSGLLVSFQRVYLAAAAPGRHGWHARQIAARTAELAQHLAALRERARSPDAVRLLERLEVVCTRLDLLDAEDPAAVQSFEALLARSGLAGEIDRVLSSGTETLEVRASLLEARLVLTGA
jgi:chromosome segregation ATPase